MASSKPRLLLLLLLWLNSAGNWRAIGLHPCDQSSCYPPPGNLLIGRESQLHATSTCGLERQESYCTRENGRKKCFWCDSRPINTNYPQFSHNIHNVVSQSSPKPSNERRTWWQAESGREDVSIQFDLEDTFDFISLHIKFKSLPPAAMQIERSYDFGSTWQVYKYFARNCDLSFPEVPSYSPRDFSDVTCESLSPTLQREVLFRVPTVPLTIKSAFSEALNIRKITNLRLRFTKLETLGDVLEKRGVKRLYYYAVSELVVLGTCSCSGHAAQCKADTRSRSRPSEAGAVRGLCLCSHHTQGNNCQRCEDLYNDVPWQPALGKFSNPCKKCNCNGHSISCHFDAAAYILSGNVSGGICDSCQHNTMGTQCEQCKPYFYQDASRSFDDPEVCQPCGCDPRGSESAPCAQAGGQCYCRKHAEGRRCDRCQHGYTWRMHEGHIHGCQECLCNNHTSSCHLDEAADEVTCDSCQHNTRGKECELCKIGFYKDPERSLDDPEVCKECNCNNHTSLCHFDNASDVSGERCDSCQHNTMGKNCDLCITGFYKNPERSSADPEMCQQCNCNNHSSSCHFDDDASVNEVVCEFCQHNTMGKECESCKPGFYQDPTRSLVDPEVCQECNCNNHSSSCYYSTDVSAAVCEFCQHNTTGNSCELCKPGFYRDPRRSFSDPEACQECNCNNHASSCYFHEADDLSGERCESCQHNTTGNNCQVCKPGFYKDPLLSLADPEVCRVCKCNNHALSCSGHHAISDTLFDNKVTEAVCDSCQHNTMGNSCELCKPHFYQNPERSIDNFDACQPCDCDRRGCVEDDSTCDSHSDKASGSQAGRCHCRENVEGSRCDQCRPGFWNLSKQHPGGCQECSCHPDGSLDVSCDPHSGECVCRPGIGGELCDECQAGSWGFPKCLPCQCNGNTHTCDAATGTCKECRNNTTGDHCETCLEGYFEGESSCEPCRCPNTAQSGHSFAARCSLDAEGAIVCECQEGYTGAQCNVCANDYYGNPGGSNGSCLPCNCNRNVNPWQRGSCDSLTGKCINCLFNTEGGNCENCISGFFGDALNQRCEECDCNPLGTNHTAGACDSASGQCPCLPHVVGLSCSECSPGFWRLASGQGCEPCGCQPTGSNTAQCNQFDGLCDCKPGYIGYKCDEVDKFIPNSLNSSVKT